jgi:hypothetical protein
VHPAEEDEEVKGKEEEDYMLKNMLISVFSISSVWYTVFL